jgi:hypothetical protein
MKQACAAQVPETINHCPCERQWPTCLLINHVSQYYLDAALLHNMQVSLSHRLGSKLCLLETFKWSLKSLLLPHQVMLLNGLENKKKTWMPRVTRILFFKKALHWELPSIS